jgi:hypothetical protein
MRVITAVLLLSLSLAAHAQAPLYQQTVVNTGDLRSGDVVVTIGMSNWKQISDQVKFPSVSWVNASCGGCTISTWATGKSTGPKGQTLWPNVPKNADIIWINPVNRASKIAIDPYVANVTSDLTKTLNYISANYSVREVWLTGLHGEPFAPLSSKQPNLYAWWSGKIADDFPKSGYPFVLRHAAYIYAETTPRGDGLFWQLSDFSSDKLHLSNTGNKKAAGLLEDYMDNALGGDPGPDPDPDPEPEQVCHCRFPHTFTTFTGVCKPVAPQTQCRVE